MCELYHFSSLSLLIHGDSTKVEYLEHLLFMQICSDLHLLVQENMS